MKTVYVVRHGESEGNVGRFYQGPDNSSLTEHGREQARFIAERCSRLPFEVLIASPALRARQTAEMIAERTGHEIEWSDLLAELAHPTSVLGKSEDDPEARLVNDAWDLGLYGNGPKVDDGEYFPEVFARIDEVLAHLHSREESNILLVTHGLFLRALLARILIGEGITPEQFKRFIFSTRTKNTGITIITDNSILPGAPWQLSVFNDHSHLG